MSILRQVRKHRMAALLITLYHFESIQEGCLIPVSFNFIGKGSVVQALVSIVPKFNRPTVYPNVLLRMGSAFM